MTGYLNRARSLLTTLSFAICVSAAVTGCKSGGGGDSASVAPATSVPTTSTTPTPTTSNSAPTIAGTAATSVRVSTAYAFAPAASDANGDALTFQIQNKPAWATFNTVTGQLSGTPTSVATFSNIVITVSDGKAATALPAFAIQVTAAPTGQVGSATLSWAAPTQNTDGSALTNLAGFVIAYGTSAGSLSQSIKVTNPSVSTYVIDSLPAGTYYFAVKAYTANGAESGLSSVVSKAIG
jgi:Putative Ig domain